jgi:hypothetical protein
MQKKESFQDFPQIVVAWAKTISATPLPKHLQFDISGQRMKANKQRNSNAFQS